MKSVKLPERHETKEETPQTFSGRKNLSTTLESVIATKVEEGDVPTPSTSPLTPEEKAARIAPVHTYKADVEHAVESQKVSVVHAASLEEERRHRKEKPGEAAPAPTPIQAKQKKRVGAIVFTSLLLFVLGAAALGGVYFVATRNNAPAPEQNFSSLIFSESTIAFPIDDQAPGDIKRTLGSARASTGGNLGSITRIVPTRTVGIGESAAQSPVSFSEFMRAIQSGAPEELLRAAEDEFFFGIHTVDENAPLIVVPITSFDRAFAAMLAWESSMNAGLIPIFTSVPAQKFDANGLPITRTFQDIIMRNYDVRALKDDAGNIQLYYSFPTQHILIIAESPYSFAEVLSRLQAGRRL